MTNPNSRSVLCVQEKVLFVSQNCSVGISEQKNPTIPGVHGPDIPNGRPCKKSRIVPSPFPQSLSAVLRAQNHGMDGIGVGVGVGLGCVELSWVGVGLGLGWRWVGVGVGLGLG